MAEKPVSGRELLQRAVGEGRNLLEPEAMELCREFGLPLPLHRWVDSAPAAAEAARALGFPVVIKVVSPDILHKSDGGGVRTDITSPAEACRAYRELAALAAGSQARWRGALVCAQAPAGLELVAGMVSDPEFGPALMFGLGGVAVELFQDVAFASVPVTPERAYDLLEQTQAGKLLRGYRGPRLDVDAVVSILTGLSRLVEHYPEISEVDLNPLRAYNQGALILDARIIVSS